MYNYKSKDGYQTKEFTFRCSELIGICATLLRSMGRMPRKRYTSLKYITGSYQQGFGQDRPEIYRVLIKQQKRRYQCLRPILRQLSEVVVALISKTIE